MKLSRYGQISLVFLGIFVLFGGIGASLLIAYVGSDNSTQNIQTFVLTSFENRDEWDVTYSMFVSKKFDSAKKKYVTDETKVGWKAFPGKPGGVRGERAKKEKNVLAVKASFDRKGYNWIEIEAKKKLAMVGKVQAIDVWVWGGNFKYRLELHLEDYRGYRHVLDGGWLDYTGWRNIRLDIPKNIPQGEKYVPRLKTLKFVKFVIYSHPAERNDIFYVYFDRMQIQSDIYLQRFDGDDLVNEGFKSGWMPKQETLQTKTKTTSTK